MKRLRALLARIADRLDRSAHVFLIGVIVACAVEVAVDWNATLRDINVLRATMRQKGENYLGILRSAAADPLLAYDGDALDLLAQPLLDDGDVVYVRFSDALGNTVTDRLRPEYAKSFREANDGESFREHYRRLIDRDTGGMISDPALLARHMEASRHRDFIQMWSDAESAIGRWWKSGKETPSVASQGPRILYQDRLADPNGSLDRRITWAIGAVVAEDDEPFGVVLIALDQQSVNAASRSKLYQGLAMTIFFVGLIVLQNISARRSKLRRLELEVALSSARTAIRGALPKVPALAWCDLGIGFAQDERVGGTLYDLRAGESSIELLLAVPEGAGVDAAFASVVLRDVYRRETHEGAPLDEQLWAMLRGYRVSPLARAVDVMLLCIEPGRVRGVVAGLLPPSEIKDGALVPLPLGDPLTPPQEVQSLVSAARRFDVSLPGGTLVLFDDGKPLDVHRTMPLAEIDALLAQGGSATAQELADKAVAHAVKRTRGRHGDDFFALVVTLRGKAKA